MTMWEKQTLQELQRSSENEEEFNYGFSSLNPETISDQNMSFSGPLFRPGLKNQCKTVNQSINQSVKPVAVFSEIMRNTIQWNRLKRLVHLLPLSDVYWALI